MHGYLNVKVSVVGLMCWIACGYYIFKDHHTNDLYC